MHFQKCWLSPLIGLNVLCLSYFSFIILSVFALGFRLKRLNKRQYAILLLDVAETRVTIEYLPRMHCIMRI